MASRREQLEAYIFARRRMVAAFLQPAPSGGSEENAPKPLKAIAPSLVVAALVLIGFGVFGLIKPGTPRGWKDGGSLIVGRDSASRYVYLDGKLHPVLNIASGRLLLDPGKFKVNMVPEKALNSVDHGAPLGIPNAPDRLPTAGDVRKPKTWTVCERPANGKDGTPDVNLEPQRSVFIGAAPGEGTLQQGESLFVKDKENRQYLVHQGKRYLVRKPTVVSAMNLVGIQPQPVSHAWLDTLIDGGEIDHPDIPGYGSPAPATLKLSAQYNTVGLVLRAEGGAQRQQYVVTREGVMPVSPLTAALLTSRPDAKNAYKNRTITDFPVNIGELGAAVVPGVTFNGEKGWPETAPTPMNRIERNDLEVPRNVVCNTFAGEWRGDQPITTQSAWTAPPERLVEGMGGVWVRPGTGVLFREVTGSAAEPGGSLYLLTDSGLRYGVPNEAQAGGGGQGGERESEAKTRLGYKGVEPAAVPRAWSELIQRGPQLSTTEARKPQGS